MNCVDLLSRHFLMIFKNHCRYIVLSRNVIINRESQYYKRLVGTSINQSSEESDEFEYEDVFAQPEQIAGNNPEKLNRVKKIVCEIDFIMQSGKLIYFPRKLTKENWQHLLTLDSEKSRQNYYKHLCIKEKLKECKNIKKEQKKVISRLTHREAVPSTSSSITNNSLNCKKGCFMFLPKFKTLATRLRLYKVAQAMIFGPHLIIDCSGDYESHMTNREMKMCARQIISARCKNQNSLAPFNILHCNLNPEGRLMNELKRFLPNLDKPEKFFNFTEKSHAELFPVDQLVYLSPHSDNELDSYDPCCTYIVGTSDYFLVFMFILLILKNYFIKHFLLSFKHI